MTVLGTLEAGSLEYHQMCLLCVRDIYTDSSPSRVNAEDRQMHNSHGGRIGN